MEWVYSQTGTKRMILLGYVRDVQGTRVSGDEGKDRVTSEFSHRPLCSLTALHMYGQYCLCSWIALSSW